MDTPDFDTGARGQYTNRELALQSLETADIFIYIFTNSNYNNRDNTDFIAKALTGIGLRKCYLVYRVYPSFTDQEVMEHASTVAGNLYGENANDHILGIFRADEDNAVAAGEQLMSLRPLRENDTSLFDAIGSIKPQRLRMDLYSSILADVIENTQDILHYGDISCQALKLYLLWIAVKFYLEICSV